MLAIVCVPLIPVHSDGCLDAKKLAPFGSKEYSTFPFHGLLFHKHRTTVYSMTKVTNLMVNTVVRVVVGLDCCLQLEFSPETSKVLSSDGPGSEAADSKPDLYSALQAR